MVFRKYDILYIYHNNTLIFNINFAKCPRRTKYRTDKNDSKNHQNYNKNDIPIFDLISKFNDRILEDQIIQIN